MEAVEAQAVVEPEEDASHQEEQEEEAQRRQPQHASHRSISALGPTDEGRMNLSAEEHEWALAIKEALMANPELEDKPSDFMIAQLAIVHHNDIETAMETAFRIQETREQYKIRDTYQDAYEKLTRSLELHYGTHMYFGFNHEEARYVAVFDIGRFDSRVSMNPRNAEYCFGGGWYCYHAMSPDFESVRRGAIILMECQGYDWSQRQVDLQYAQRHWSDVAGVYPLMIHRFKCFHTPTVFNIVKAVCKRLIPSHIERSVQLGCQYNGRLDALYLVPSVEAARQRVLVRMLECLQRRFAAEQSFRL
ncbi:expressed unknown protein [Seminavis robusta]|uniref:CRAL-TRIO domain-containing protein n=1 Tax=Seminavis robusta TaxID=568900 RepID=A0A9N8E5D3_9STRA|nr:expressed unknown protein [Seminavis robusta]|eukprot:Sro635_g179160.1 n/a (305) ;mRNA; f:40968-41882